MKDKWHPELPDRPLLGYPWLVVRWDWPLLGWWLIALGSCVAFWALLGLTLSGIAY